MEGKTCFFIGHHTAGPEASALLDEAVERHIVEYGVTSFTVGHYGGFDYQAGRAVIRAKVRHPDINLTLLLPYHPFDRPIEMPEGFDATFYPPGMEVVPRKLAIVRANRYMVDHSDYLIAYVKYPGNARELVEYARRRKSAISVENLALLEPSSLRGCFRSC